MNIWSPLILFFLLSAHEAIFASLSRLFRNAVFQAACVGYAFGKSNGDEVAYSWDTKWKSAVKSYEDRWTAEFSIPFHSLRYFEGSEIWGINFGRLDLKTNEKSAWAPMPRQAKHNNLAFAGTLIWDEPLQKAGMGYFVLSIKQIFAIFV